MPTFEEILQAAQQRAHEAGEEINHNGGCCCGVIQYYIASIKPADVPALAEAYRNRKAKEIPA